MRKKAVRIGSWIAITVVLTLVIRQFTPDGTATVISIIPSTLLQIALDRPVESFAGLKDAANWKATRHRLMRDGHIEDSTLVRISFAYLYRIRVGNKYLLVMNERGTQKYQPVGGVYKMRSAENRKLKNLFSVSYDDKIPVDESSRDDYRLYVPNEHLPRFVSHFDKGAMRERIDNIGREFREELVDTGILDWDRIEYRYCGRHMTDLQFELHFQTYELVLADIVELCPSRSQQMDLQNLVDNCPPQCRFATSKEIRTLGVDTEHEELGDTIATHTFKILPEEENSLLKPREAGKTYRVRL